MKLLFSSKEKLAIAAALLFLILSIFIVQFYFLSPLKSDLSIKKQTLHTEQKLLTELSQKSKQNSQAATENTTELQRKLPVKSQQDQILLDLQEAETISKSQIKTMTFTDGGQTASSTGSQSSTTSNTGSGTSDLQSSQKAANTTSSQQQSTQSTNTSTKQWQNLTAIKGLKKITAQLNIESPTYEDLETFINSLEGMKRLFVVEAINYTGPNETKSADQTTNPLTYTLTVSAYYLPGLTDLQSQLPKVEYPDPANKANPLSKFADLQVAQ